jgi:hypothetical protein
MAGGRRIPPMEATGSCAAAGAKRGRQSRPASTRRGVSGAAGGGYKQPSPRPSTITQEGPKEEEQNSRPQGRGEDKEAPIRGRHSGSRHRSAAQGLGGAKRDHQGGSAAGAAESRCEDEPHKECHREVLSTTSDLIVEACKIATSPTDGGWVPQGTVARREQGTELHKERHEEERRERAVC